MSERPPSPDTPSTRIALITVLHEHARDPDGLPGLAPDLGAVLVRRGRAVRRRRRAVLLGGSVLATAALAVGLGALRSVPRLTPAPVPPATRAASSAASTAAPSPAASSSDKVVTADAAVTAIRALPVGRPLAPHPQAILRNGRITITDVQAGTTARLPAGMQTVSDPTALPGGGWLFSAHSDSFTGGGPDVDQALYLMRGNAVQVVHHGPFDGYAMSPDGTRVALAEITSMSEGPVHLRVRTLTGVLLADLQAPVSSEVRGWARTGVLVERGRGGADGSTYAWWSPGSRTMGRALPYVWMIVSAEPVRRTADRRPAPVVVAQTPTDTCWHVLDGAPPGLATTFACGQTEDIPTISERAEYLLIDGRVYDLRTADPDGSSRQLLDPAAATLTFWEDPTHVVAIGFGDGAQTLYGRCDVTTGRCEQAPEPRAADGTPLTIAW